MPEKDDTVTIEVDNQQNNPLLNESKSKDKPRSLFYSPWFWGLATGVLGVTATLAAVLTRETKKTSVAIEELGEDGSWHPIDGTQTMQAGVWEDIRVGLSSLPTDKSLTVAISNPGASVDELDLVLPAETAVLDVPTEWWENPIAVTTNNPLGLSPSGRYVCENLPNMHGPQSVCPIFPIPHGVTEFTINNLKLLPGKPGVSDILVNLISTKDWQIVASTKLQVSSTSYPRLAIEGVPVSSSREIVAGESVKLFSNGDITIPAPAPLNTMLDDNAHRHDDNNYGDVSPIGHYGLSINLSLEPPYATTMTSVVFSAKSFGFLQQCNFPPKTEDPCLIPETALGPLSSTASVVDRLNNLTLNMTEPYRCVRATIRADMHITNAGVRSFNHTLSRLFCSTPNTAAGSASSVSNSSADEPTATAPSLCLSA